MLHTATEELASFWSEVAQGDLRHPTPRRPWDIGDLYLHLTEQNLDVASALTDGTVAPNRRLGPTDKTTLAASVNMYGGGLETGYRRAAKLMTDGFAAVADGHSALRMDRLTERGVDLAILYERQIRHTVVHTWDLAQALGLPYEPAADITHRVLQTALSLPTATEGDRAFRAVLTLTGRADFGIVFGGSGQGEQIAANKVHGVRAALCESEFMARLAREHNDANVLALGARLIGEEVAKGCLKVFLETEFEGGRHQRRVSKLGTGN
jgi:uncharacterized protein (TIGR03083 family)